MKKIDTINALKRLSKPRNTDAGQRIGFLMRDATGAFGGLAAASNTMMVLMAEGVVGSEPVLIDGEVHTLYRLTDVPAPTVH